MSGDRIDTKIYSDIKDDIFELEKNWPESHSPVRKVNQLVIELGGKEAVDTYLVTPPLICKRSTTCLSMEYVPISCSRPWNRILHAWLWPDPHDDPACTQTEESRRVG